MMASRRTKPERKVSLVEAVRAVTPRRERAAEGKENVQYRGEHDAACENVKGQLGPDVAEAGVAGELALPENEGDPAEAADDEDGYRGAAAPGVVADGGLVDDEDGQDGGGEDEDGAEVVEAAHVNLDKELVVLGPEEQ